ncbi:arylamine N-acetyltransferase family protein [Caulobacter segnis]
MFDAPAPVVDLDAYFGRIGYDGPRAPTLETLRAIAVRHPDAIPFENLDVLLGRGISIIPADIDAELIGGGRGGCCATSRTVCFKRVLQALGFQVEGLMARALSGWLRKARRRVRARTRCWASPSLENLATVKHWLVDAGFGGCVLTAPLRSVLRRGAGHPARQVPDPRHPDGRRGRAPGPGRPLGPLGDLLYQVSRGALGRGRL